MNMNRIILLAISILVVTCLTACSKKEESGSASTVSKPAQLAETAIEQSYTHIKNRRTWVVHRVDFDSPDHMGVGDGFRIVKNGPIIRMKPLSGLQIRWGRSGNSPYTVILKKKADDLFCGEVKIVGHVPNEHTIAIEQIDIDELYISFPDDSDDIPDPCLSENTHGGRAHAQN